MAEALTVGDVRRRRALICDVDGTLLDTLPLVRHGLHQATLLQLAGLGLTERPGFERFQALLQRCVGGSAAETVLAVLAELAGQHAAAGLDPVEVAAVIDAVQDRLAATHVRPYDGLEELLSAAGDRRIPVVLATSGTPYHVGRNFSAALGLPAPVGDGRQQMGDTLGALRSRLGLHVLEAVTCEDVERTKPAPDTFQLALELAGVPAHDAVAVGDHGVDMVASAAAGIPVRIGVTHGFGTAEELTRAGATHVVASLGAVEVLLG